MKYHFTPRNERIVTVEDINIKIVVLITMICGLRAYFCCRITVRHLWNDIPEYKDQFSDVVYIELNQIFGISPGNSLVPDIR